MPCQRYIVAEPSDIKKAQITAMKIIGLNYRISESGQLKKSVLTSGAEIIMGISDDCMASVPQQTDILCADIFYEAKSMGCRGILFDLENNSPEMYPFVSQLSYGLHCRGMLHFVPERFHSAAPYAKLLVDAAVSGGSFSDMYRHNTEKYGADRVCFELTPVCRDFIVPAYEPDGRQMSAEQLAAIIKELAPSVYFSQELMAKYFTYRDQNGKFHFIIFDDAATMQEKLSFFDRSDADSVFMLFSDWQQFWGGGGTVKAPQ